MMTISSGSPTLPDPPLLSLPFCATRIWTTTTIEKKIHGAQSERKKKWGRFPFPLATSQFKSLSLSPSPLYTMSLTKRVRAPEAAFLPYAPLPAENPAYRARTESDPGYATKKAKLIELEAFACNIDEVIANLKARVAANANRQIRAPPNSPEVGPVAPVAPGAPVKNEPRVSHFHGHDRQALEQFAAENGQLFV
jgi:hypothetical protein